MLTLLFLGSGKMELGWGSFCRHYVENGNRFSVPQPTSLHKVFLTCPVISFWRCLFWLWALSTEQTHLAVISYCTMMIFMCTRHWFIAVHCNAANLSGICGIPLLELRTMRGGDYKERENCVLFFVRRVAMKGYKNIYYTFCRNYLRCWTAYHRKLLLMIIRNVTHILVGIMSIRKRLKVTYSWMVIMDCMIRRFAVVLISPLLLRQKECLASKYE